VPLQSFSHRRPRFVKEDFIRIRGPSGRPSGLHLAVEEQHP
jgi:hypothetical protein